MSDPTETIRRQELAEINKVPSEREALGAKYGQVWSTDELREDFDVLGFMAPYVVVTRKSDDVRGSLQFQHNPRLWIDLRSSRWRPNRIPSCPLGHGGPSGLALRRQWIAGRRRPQTTGGPMAEHHELAGCPRRRLVKRVRSQL